MWWLFLDESGDLGFDFVNKNPSKFFTVCILAVSRKSALQALSRAVARTLRRKLNPSKKRSRFVEELKGSSTAVAVKNYAWRHVEDVQFGIYCITLDKRKVYKRLADNKHRTYNYVARLVVDQIPFERAVGNVQLVVDRSKGKRQVWEFNSHIRKQLEGRIDPDVALDFTHGDSKEWPGLQWADLFAWGVYQKYEHRDTEWYDVFKDKIRYEDLYLK